MEAVEKSSLLLCWLSSAGIPAGSGAPSAQWAGKRQETGGWPYVCAKESEGNGEEQEWSGGTHQKVRHPPASKFTTIAQVLLIELIDLIFTSLIDLVETSRGCVSGICAVVYGADQIRDRWSFINAVSRVFLSEGRSWRSAAPVQSYKQKRLSTVDCRWRPRSSRSDQSAQTYNFVCIYHGPLLCSQIQCLDFFWKVNQLITSHMKPLWKSINKHSVILFCHSFCYVLLLKQTTIIFHGIEAPVISGIILPTVTAHVFYRIHWIEHFRKKKSQSVILTRYRLSGLLTGWDWFLKKWNTD